jgi:hypothetical protein
VVGAQGEHGENGSLLATTERHAATVDQQIDPAEDFYLEGHSWLTPPVSPPKAILSPNRQWVDTDYCRRQRGVIPA